jgi:acyl-CoA synthetase (AMP-forming)/AMP-acid ligase II
LFDAFLRVVYIWLYSDGFLQLTDRSKDVIKSGGEWISSIDLENEAVAHPKVLEAAVVGVPHPKWEERPLLIVVPKTGQTVTRDEILTFLTPRLAKWWLPDGMTTLTLAIIRHHHHQCHHPCVHVLLRYRCYCT